MAKLSTNSATKADPSLVNKTKVDLQKALKNLMEMLSRPDIESSEHYKAGKLVAETSRQNLNRLTRTPNQLALHAANHMMRTVVKFTDELHKTYDNPNESQV